MSDPQNEAGWLKQIASNTTPGSGGGPATIADGADVAEGATTDAVVAAGAAGSVSAKLRRLTTDISAFLVANHIDLTAATPAGTNVIGGVTIANGSNIAEGSTTDTSYSDGTGAANGSLVALNKGQYVLMAALSAKLPASLGIKTAAASLSIAPASDANFQVTNRGTDATNAAPTVNPTYISGLVSSTGVQAYTTGRVAPPSLTLAGELITASGGVGTNSADGLGIGVNLMVARDGTARIVGVASWVWNGTGYDRLVKPNATSRLLSSAATTNGTSVKASAGNIFKIVGNNTAITKRYLKLYNKASAPTVGTDTPFQTFALLASSAFDISFTTGMYFSTGIAYAITGAAADADTTAIVAGDIECLNIGYA